MRRTTLLLAAITLFAANAFTTTFCLADDAASLFRESRQKIFQIRIIDNASGKKSAIGSGFAVSEDGLIATNYHVISQVVLNRGKYRVTGINYLNDEYPLALVNIDVVNDLALLRSEVPLAPPFQLAGSELAKGDDIYSIGNPLDLGLTVIPGTYNGIDPNSYYQRVHFSGSLNPGMSGGPTLDENGHVIGINVSSYGNQVSFLVPVARLVQLLAEHRVAPPVVDFMLRMKTQLMANQAALVAEMLEKDWPTQPLGEGRTLSDFPPFTKCWGGSNSENREARHLQLSSTCAMDETIFVDRGFNTGTVNYQFFWLETEQLNSWQFYNLYHSLFSAFTSDNQVRKKYAGNFDCDTVFVRPMESGEHTFKTVLCARAYKELEGLYDILYLQGSVDEHKRAFIGHYTLAGVDRDSAQAFLERFNREVTWP